MWTISKLSKICPNVIGFTGKNLLSNYYNKQLRFISTNSAHYDVIIVGGGLVGTTLACTLGKNSKLSNKKILLLEASKPFKWSFQEQYSIRVSALNPQTFDLFNKIGIWKYISNVRFGTVKKMQVWDAISDATITFENQNLIEPIAYIVENDLILAAVNNELKNLENITVINEVKVKDYILSDANTDVSKIVMNDGKYYTCELLIGCDGIKSRVRQAMNVNYISWDYDHKAIVSTLKLSEPTENVVAWQRMLPTGALALLPLNNQLSSLVWTVPNKNADELLKLSDEKFIDALNEAVWKNYECSSVIHDTTRYFNKFLESFNLPSNDVKQLPPHLSGVLGNRATFPLGFGHAANYVGNGVVLVGDAAHRVHPLAGQGVNLGFGDILTLEKAVSEAIYSGSSIGNMNYLRQYESERQRHNVPMMIAIDGLEKISKTEFMPIVLLRSLGFQFAHAMNPLKKAIIDFAAH